MITEYTLTLQLRAPLALHRTRAGGQYVDSLDYIPGTALRGALAEAYLAQHGTPDKTFHILFLSDQVQYGDLWPAIEGSPTILLPATAQVCKRYGFGHKNSFRDGLLDALADLLPTRRCAHIEDKRCDEPLDRTSGYLCSLDPVEHLAPRIRLRVSTAIGRGTGTAAREMLFTQHTLTGKSKSGNKALLFQGVLQLTDPRLRAELDDLLKLPLFLGSGRSRGLGEVEVKTWKETGDGDSLPKRWHKFNETARRAGGDPNLCYFSLTLLSHLALRDDLLRPVLDEITPQHFGLPDTVKWVCYKNSGWPVLFLSTVTVAGWNAALGLPKSDTVTLARRSVLLAKCPADQEQAVLKRLARIESQGLGERRNEGFGRVVACYPIHYECWR